MATNTYVALAKQTLTTATAEVTFSSLGSYTDIILVSNFGTTAAGNSVGLRFNSDTGSNYSTTQINGPGPYGFSWRGSNQTSITVFGSPIADGTPSTLIANGTIHIQNYGNSTTNKTVLSRYGYATGEVIAGVGLWRNTNAITSFTLVAVGSTFLSGSTFSLYGIKSEETAAKATGGMVTSDATYFYHTFLSSGTFTPKQSLTCDYLVVAGGGGGGGNRGGGGGAGGLLNGTTTFSASSFTYTQGGGGAGNATGNDSGSQGTNSTLSGTGVSLTATGGGYGGGVVTNRAGGNGGSGGGGACFNVSTAAGGTGSQGSNGGGGATSTGASGGGGYSAAGGSSTTGAGGSGGAGTSSFSSWGLATSTGQNVTGTYYYAGGGGGGAYYSTLGAAGIGGGGIGGSSSDTPGNGLANTGGGGGGSGELNVGGNGGSGILIIRYAK